MNKFKQLAEMSFVVGSGDSARSWAGRYAQQQSACAATAILVKQRGLSESDSFIAVNTVIRELDSDFQATWPDRWVRYAEGCMANDEKASNRKWEEYPPEVRQAAKLIADQTMWLVSSHDH
jgi:hypothetical protein